MHAVKLECQRLISIHHADFDFTPIHQLSLKDLSEVVRREREKASVDPQESPSSVNTKAVNPAAPTVAEGSTASGIGGRVSSQPN